MYFLEIILLFCYFQVFFIILERLASSIILKSKPFSGGPLHTSYLKKFCVKEILNIFQAKQKFATIFHQIQSPKLKLPLYCASIKVKKSFFCIIIIILQRPVILFGVRSAIHTRTNLHTPHYPPPCIPVQRFIFNLIIQTKHLILRAAPTESVDRRLGPPLPVNSLPSTSSQLSRLIHFFSCSA